MTFGGPSLSSTPRGAPVAGSVGAAGISSTPRGAPVAGGANVPPSSTPASSSATVKVEAQEGPHDDLDAGRKRHARLVNLAIRELREADGPKRPDAFLKVLLESDEADRFFGDYGPSSHFAFIQQVTALTDPVHMAATNAIDVPLEATVATASSLRQKCAEVLPPVQGMLTWVLTADTTYWPDRTQLAEVYDPFNVKIPSVDVVCANHRDQMLAEKALSRFLRHCGADQRFDVGMDTGGWVSVHRLLDFVRH